MKSFQASVKNGAGTSAIRRFMRDGAVGICAPLILVVILTGCTRSPASRHYVFAPRDGWHQVAVRDSVSSDYTIRFALVKLPSYLDRPQIVTRASDNEIRVDQFNRWGMPLSQTVTELLGGTIAKQLTNAYVDVVTATSNRQPGYLVQTDVVRMDGFLGGPVELIAQWQVTRGGSEPVVLARRLSRYELETTDPNIEAYVEAIRSLMVLMGEEVAGVIENDRNAIAQQP